MISLFPSSQSSAGRSVEWKPAMITALPFRKKRNIWLEPEQSIGKYLRSFGNKSCWEAIGPARQAFLSLGAEIKEYLEQCSEPIPSWVTWSVYMVGKSEDSAEPTIIFCSDATRHRHQIRKIVKHSGILEKYPGFATGDMAKPPDINRLVQVGGTLVPKEKKQKPARLNAVLKHAISMRELHGMRIIVSNSNPNIGQDRKATAGGLIVLGEECFYMTAAHPFEEKFVESAADADEANSQYSFDDDRGSEDDEGEAEDFELLSDGSVTTEQDSSRNSYSSHESSPPPNLIWDSPEFQSKEYELPYCEPESQILQSFSRPNDYKPELLGCTGSRPGELNLTSTNSPYCELDYALLSFPTTESNADDEVFESTQYTLGQYTDASWLQFDRADVFALKASGKHVSGQLSGTPVFTCLPTSNSFQEVYAAKFDWCLEQGDCGTWVVEQKSGKLIGHIVAGCTANNVAYIVPAYQIFKDIERRTGHIPRVVISTFTALDRREPILCVESKPRNGLTGNKHYDGVAAGTAMHKACSIPNSLLTDGTIVHIHDDGCVEARDRASCPGKASNAKQCARHGGTSSHNASCACLHPNLRRTVSVCSLQQTTKPALDAPEFDEMLEHDLKKNFKDSYTIHSAHKSQRLSEVPEGDINQFPNLKKSIPSIPEAALVYQFRRLLSLRRMEALSNTARVHRKPQAVSASTCLSIEPPPPNEYVPRVIHNLALFPEAPTETRSIRFRDMLHNLSNIPCKWENPGLLDEALRVVPLERIYDNAEVESQVFEGEAQSLGIKPTWGYQDCVIRSLMHWFKSSYFSWVNNPPCEQCGGVTLIIGMASPTPDEYARGAKQVELYKCSLGKCGNYERFPRYSDAFVLLETRKGRVGEWSNCFGMLCRAIGARVRWVWNSEDHVWLEVYSVHRKRWVAVDICEETWDKPTLYTQGWNRKLAYCIGFSADGCMDVTRRYVRNFSQWGAERSRCSEPVLLHILNEIRAMRRVNLSKQDRFRLKGEDNREECRLQGYITTALVAEVCKIIPGRFYENPPRGPSPSPDAQKLLEAREEAQRAEDERRRVTGPNDP